jgi:hypothetical protein
MNEMSKKWADERKVLVKRLVDDYERLKVILEENKLLFSCMDISIHESDIGVRAELRVGADIPRTKDTL